ncbi:YdeI/OmpD-associated family protein [Actinomadura bangladeshensis]|uniref:YdeI/OmpD-associated family protein n=1 Tax=Actinomadura bangladeshensis TaxID=453573 RepID=UPI003CD06789
MAPTPAPARCRTSLTHRPDRPSLGPVPRTRADRQGAPREVPHHRRAARAAYDALTDGRKRGHVRAIESAKKPETRRRRIEKAVTALRGRTPRRTPPPGGAIAARMPCLARPPARPRRPVRRRKTRWQGAEGAATLPEAVPENEEVVPVNAVSTWVLPSGVTVGR